MKFNMNEKRIITDCSEITPEWLTEIFRENGYLNHGEVEKIVKVTPVRGLTSSLAVKI